MAAEAEAERKQLRKLFEEIDEDGSGLLDRDEVYELAEKLGATLSTAELDDARTNSSPCKPPIIVPR